MDWHTSWFKERRTLVHTVLVLIVALTLVLVHEPIDNIAGNITTTAFYYPFFKLRDALTQLTHTADENAALRTSLVQLSNRLQQFTETMEENRRLRALLGFVPPATFRIVPTEIIGVFGSGIPNTVQINLGARDTIIANQTVINQNGLAGRVARVMNDYSVVYLLTEPRCRVAARVKRSREQGIIRFSLSRGMYLDNLPRQGDVAVGDTVITSGLGGIFPEGIVIGTISRAEIPEREFFYDITVEPAVNFNGLDELYILMQEGL